MMKKGYLIHAKKIHENNFIHSLQSTNKSASANLQPAK